MLITLRYIPFSSRNVRLRSFFFALAEMLRRWQWNFCMFETINLETNMLTHLEVRVETEHLGNADAYRVGSWEYIQQINANCLCLGYSRDPLALSPCRS